jgi:hypothetical protein
MKTPVQDGIKFEPTTPSRKDNEKKKKETVPQIVQTGKAVRKKS